MKKNLNRPNEKLETSPEILIYFQLCTLSSIDEINEKRAAKGLATLSVTKQVYKKSNIKNKTK